MTEHAEIVWMTPFAPDPGPGRLRGQPARGPAGLVGARGVAPRSAPRPPTPGPKITARAFTLVELLTLVVLLAIVAGLALPLLGNPSAYRLREAARLVAADLQFAQADSLAHPDQPRAVVFDVTGRRYWIAPRVAGQPGQAPQESAAIPDPTRRDPLHPHRSAPFSVTFPSGDAPGPPDGRAAALVGVTLGTPQNLVVSGSLHFLPFDALGTPLGPDGQPAAGTARIPLTSGGATLRIEVAPYTGEVTIP